MGVGPKHLTATTCYTGHSNPPPIYQCWTTVYLMLSWIYIAAMCVFNIIGVFDAALKQDYTPKTWLAGVYMQVTKHCCLY